MSNPAPNITIPVDLTNPGQFFACCGLLELADRLWAGPEGWFERHRFCILTSEPNKKLKELLSEVVSCPFHSTLLPENQIRLQELDQKKRELKKQRKSLPTSDEAERKKLNSLRIFSGFILGPPFNLRIDWWLDDIGDGDNLKTWAGQQPWPGSPRQSSKL